MTSQSNDIIGHRLPCETAAEKAADRVIHVLRTSGFSAYRVGGAVRDRLLGTAPCEVDVATDARPPQIQGVFPRTSAVGAAFGVVIVHADDGIDVEVATFRAEADYTDGRRPDTVTFADAEADAERRDFTVNALFYDPESGAILDFCHGLADLRRGVVRAVGDPDERFAEDRLRLLRAVRFSAQLGFDLDSETRRAIQRQSAGLRSLSAERVFAEIDRMLHGRRPHQALQTMNELGLLQDWLPELTAMPGTPQHEAFHPEGDVWQHTLLMLEALRAPSSPLAWSVLLHDVGKPVTLQWCDGRPANPGHAAEGEFMARHVLQRLRASRGLTDAVGTIVRRHMTFKDTVNMRESTLRRFISAATFHEELELHRLDCISSHRMLDNYVFLLDRLREFAAEPVIPPPLVTGHDVLALGVRPGPLVGRVLHEAEELQLDGELRDREEALEWLQHRLSGRVDERDD